MQKLKKTPTLFKTATIYFFVFLYLVAMLRPIAPFVEYAINYDYISKVLCINKDKPEMNCNGKCQLMKELEKLRRVLQKQDAVAPHHSWLVVDA